MFSVKPWTEARNNKYMKYHSKLTYQLSFWNVSRKVDYHAGGKWFIHGPKVNTCKFLCLAVIHFFEGGHFENAQRVGVHPKMFISTLRIFIIWALCIQKKKLIDLWWLWPRGLPSLQPMPKYLAFLDFHEGQRFVKIWYYLKNVRYINMISIQRTMF